MKRLLTLVLLAFLLMSGVALASNIYKAKIMDITFDIVTILNISPEGRRISLQLIPQTEVGQTANFYIYIVNEGDQEAEFTLNLYADNKLIETTNETLEALEGKDFVIDHKFDEIGTYNIKAVVVSGEWGEITRMKRQIVVVPAP